MATLFNFPYRTVAEVSLRDLIKNLVVLRTISQKEIIPVIKADAYGHGMVPVAKALVSRGSCHTLSVATLEEAIELRKKIPYAISILVLSGFYPHQVDAYLKHRLTPVIHSLVHLKSLLHRKQIPDFHLKIDTGMHRLGLLPDEISEAVKTLKKMGVKLSGLATHFADSESITSGFVDEQIELFENIKTELILQRLLHTDAKIHVSNSGGILRKKFGSSYSVRPGIALFGVTPNPRLAGSELLTPVLEWKARVLALKSVNKGETVGYGRTYTAKRKERISIISIGYADGYRRNISGHGHVLISGKKMTLKGRISMDLSAASGAAQIREGSTVILIGKDAKNEITAWDLAQWCHTIPYEILCGISPRVPRIYLD